MALETIRRRVCDQCGAGEGVRRVRISLLDDKTRTVTVDLCSEHAAPMVTAMNSKPTGLRKQRTVTPKREVTAKKRTTRARKKA